jgi:hypothetical protein
MGRGESVHYLVKNHTIMKSYRKLERRILPFGGMSGCYWQRQLYGWLGTTFKKCTQPQKLIHRCFRAMFLFLSAILSFVWRTGSINDSEKHPPLGARAALGPRIGITAVLLLGIIYLGMIVNTLKKYGSHQHHGAAHTLPHAHGKEAEAGKTQRGTAIHEPKDRQRGNDFEMEHRGRERERSASVHVRRREEDPERRGRRRKESRDTEGDSKKAGLKDMLGLRFTSHTGSQRDVVARDYLELEHHDGWN